MQRREFFSSFSALVKEKSDEVETILLRPPYNQDRTLFLSQCPDCDARCADACEEEIIKIAEDGTPFLVYGKNGCTFCDECALVCEVDVLKLEDRHNIEASISINSSSCLAWNGTMCFSCKEPCLENAIVFEGLFKPIIDTAKCTACGFCIYPCPVDAVEIKNIEVRDEHI